MEELEKIQYRWNTFIDDNRFIFGIVFTTAVLVALNYIYARF